MNMKTSFIFAFATNDGKTFMSQHFGDAEKYLIYRISDSNFEFMKVIRNTSEEEDESVHADPRKAGSITKILKQEYVDVVVSKVFGPNIKRIKKKFVCIVSKKNAIDDAILEIQKNFYEIQSEWEKGEVREHLKL